MMVPSPNTSAAGPSFFSSYSEKYSNIARTAGGEGGVVFPGRRRHRDHSRHQVDTVLDDACFQGLIESATVGLAGRTDDRTSFCTGDSSFGEPILLVRVQFSVVSHEPERLRIVGCGSVLVENRVWKYIVCTA